MAFISRAFLSIKSQKGRTLLSLITYLSIFLLVFIGLIIQGASKEQELQARQQLGADVTIKIDQKKAMQSMQQTMLSGKNEIPSLSSNSIEKLSKLSEVEDYEVNLNGSASSDKLKPIPGNSKLDDPHNQVASTNGTEKKSDSFVINGVRKSALSKDFKDETSTLVKGKHIGVNEKQPSVLVEEQLAQKNHLSVGDYISLKDKNDDIQKVKVLGIFKSEKTPHPLLAGTPSGQAGNEIYMDFETAKKFSDSTQIQEATFYLKDPLLVDSFIKDAKNLNVVDPMFKFDAHDEAYQQLVGPLKQVQSFCKSLIIISLVVGITILVTLTLSNIKQRKFEFGVLLSLGESKFKIISQLLIETFVVALVAFSVAGFIAPSVSQNIANYSLTQEIQNSKAADNSASLNGGDSTGGLILGNENQSSKEKYEPITTINTKLSKKIFSIVSLISGIVLFLATLIPSLFILRLQPKVLFQQKD